MTHKEILASFDEKFHVEGNDFLFDENGKTNLSPDNVKAFLLEALKQERLRTLEDAERVVEKNIMGRTIINNDGDPKYWTDKDEGDRKFHPMRVMEDIKADIRNLKPKDSARNEK